MDDPYDTPANVPLANDQLRIQRDSYDMSFPNPVGSVMLGPKNFRYVLE